MAGSEKTIKTKGSSKMIGKEGGGKGVPVSVHSHVKVKITQQEYIVIR